MGSIRMLRRGAVAALACAALLAACGEDDEEPLIGVSDAPYEVTLPDLDLELIAARPAG